MAWLAPILVTMAALATLTAAPQRAQAQAAPQRVIVLDFNVAQGLDPILGRKAADSLAVELQNTRTFQVITRQEIENFVAKTPGFTPPFDEATQARLGQGLAARSIFSGRVVSAAVVDQKSARIQVEVRQLDVTTADYINGAQVTEITADKLTVVDNDVLLDDAVNKATSTALRQIRQTPVPSGVVQNVTRYDLELNIGARNGVVPGQRYAVLRDQLNRALSSPGNEVVDRVKIAEVLIQRVEADQSTGIVVNGVSGVNTGDRVRRIFLANAAFPVTPTRAAGASGSNLPPVQQQGRRGGTGALGVIGGVALLGLLVLGAGFGGGGGGSSQADVAPPRDVVATPVADRSGPANIRVDYRRGIPNILAGQAVAGYFIFRGTTANFSADVGNLHDFVRGGQTTYVDDETTASTLTVTINPSSTLANGLNNVTVTTATTATGSPTLTIDDNTITSTIIRRPTISGQQYFYRVRRVTLVSNPTTGPTPTGNQGGGNNNNDEAFIPALSNPSPSSGGATTVPPVIVASTSNNLDNFSVVVNATTTVGSPTSPTNPFLFPDVDEFIVQVSTSPRFETGNRFEQIFRNPGPDANGNFNFSLGSIRVPNFEAGQTVYVRVGARNTTDNPGPAADPLTRQNYIFGPTNTLNSVTGTLRASQSRFISAGGPGRSNRGTGLPGAASSGNNRSGLPSRRPGSISRLRP